MPESVAIGAVTTPVTKSSLIKDLTELGLKSGVTVIVHCSLSSLGWVCGGPIAVIQALMEVVTASGTVVMPAHSSDNTEPSRWKDPPVPEHWWSTIRSDMPAFDQGRTPTTSMGAVAETFRGFPDVLRSYHPSVSFSAWGKHAELITKDHTLEFSLGEGSPLARIYDLSGLILLLGVGHDSNTSLHLAEARSKHMPEKLEGGSIMFEGRREWVGYRDFDYDSGDFEKIGDQFEASTTISRFKVGAATARIIRQREVVDFGLSWIEEKRIPAK